MYYAQEFQEYNPNWNGCINCDELYTEPVDLSVIKGVPMTHYLAEDDQYCLYSSEKRKYLEMGEIPKLKVIEGSDHLVGVQAMTPPVIQDIIEELLMY